MARKKRTLLLELLSETSALLNACSHRRATKIGADRAWMQWLRRRSQSGNYRFRLANTTTECL